MFCKFCNHEVDPAMHIIQCPHCGGEAHEVDEHQYECVGCGRRFGLPIPPVPMKEGEPEIDTKRNPELLMSEAQDKSKKKQLR